MPSPSTSTYCSRYHLAGSDVVIYLRHGSVDLITLEEIFQRGHYEPPTGVKGILRLVGRPLWVVDLGANIGLFAALIRRDHLGAQIVAFEPDPTNAALLRRSIEANGGQGWQLMEACAGRGEGMVPFAAHEDTSSRVEAGAGAETMVRAVDVFPFLDDVDLLKIDSKAPSGRLTDPCFQANVVKGDRTPVFILRLPVANAGAFVSTAAAEKRGFRPWPRHFILPARLRDALGLAKAVTKRRGSAPPRAARLTDPAEVLARPGRAGPSSGAARTARGIRGGSA